MSDQALAGKKVLIVEDNAFLANVISQKLTLQGAITQTYKNGLEGLAAIRTEKPDVVLLDILMPVMNGYEVLQVLHAEGLTAQVPIIVISNSGQPVEIERIKSLGVREYLVKAEFEPDDILAKITEALKLKGATTETGQAPVAAAATALLPKVLVVEDDPLLRNLLAMKLSSSNCPAMFSNDGLHVLELTSSFEPDVIVLDLKLPGKDGFEVLRELKDSAQYKQIPVVIFSNNSVDEDKQKALNLGAADFHVKAMTDLSDFIKIIIRLAEKPAT